MTLKYPDIRDWLNVQTRLVDQDWDNVHLVTGDEGTGKSTWMRKVARKIDPAFQVDRIHFEHDRYLEQAATLPAGSAIVLDEFRGHRRLAMTGDRMEFLDFLKECRGMNLHQFIGYPHVNQFERDILNDRVRWWEDLPVRGQVVIRERKARLRFRKTPTGPEPYKEIRWPEVAKYPTTQDNDPFKQEYDRKKNARMADRKTRFLEAHGRPLETPARNLDWSAAASLIDELKRNQPAP